MMSLGIGTGITHARGPSGLVLPVTSGLVAWYSADKITGLANGDPVASWTDSSGQGNTASQSTQSKQPTWQTNQINGHAAVRFDGVDDLLDTTMPAVSQPLTAFVIALPHSQSIARYVDVTSTTLTTSRCWLRTQTANTALDIFYGNEVSGTIPDQTGLAGIYSAVFNGASSIGWLNGSQVATASIAGTNSWAGLRIGSDRGLSGYLSGDIAQIVLYSRALTATERQTLDHYFSTYYSIAVSD